MKCDHDLAERETACSDGMCPLCLGEALAALAVEHQGCSAEIERLRAAVKLLGEMGNVCTFDDLGAVCSNCRCKRSHQQNGGQK